MSVRRRDFIVGSLGVAATSGLLAGCGDHDGKAGDAGAGPGPGASPDLAVFAHGVASGDPLADSILLWTRVSGQAGPVAVAWTLASDAALAQVVQAGVATASADADYTVQVDVKGLAAGTTYYYAFTVNARSRSVTGRTRTLPTALAHARLAFSSCANWQDGYFSAYRAMAKRNDLDVWIHLGDYIYEYKAGEFADPALAAERAHLPANEVTTLADYRGRYAQYRTDPDLQELHRQHPLIVVWDDHEFANNAYVGGAENHTAATEGDWTERKRAAQQAFREWLPIRVIEAQPVPKVFRSFPFGELFDLIMLDTRVYARDKQTGGDTRFGDTGDPAKWNDPDRHILGAEQASWFEAQLSQSARRGARWRLVGNQVIFTQGRNPLDNMSPHGIIFSDFWDGYQAERDRVIDYVLGNGIRNLVFLTGDIHSSWALEISKDPFNGQVYDPAVGLNGFAIELVGPSVSSQALERDPQTAALAQQLLPTVNPHLRYAELTRKGYVLLDITDDRLQVEWWYVTQYKTPGDASEELGKAFTCQQGSARLVPTTTASPGKDAPPTVA